MEQPQETPPKVTPSTEDAPATAEVLPGVLPIGDQAPAERPYTDPAAHLGLIGSPAVGHEVARPNETADNLGILGTPGVGRPIPGAPASEQAPADPIPQQPGIIGPAPPQQ